MDIEWCRDWSTKAWDWFNEEVYDIGMYSKKKVDIRDFKCNDLIPRNILKRLSANEKVTWERHFGGKMVTQMMPHVIFYYPYTSLYSIQYINGRER